MNFFETKLRTATRNNLACFMSGSQIEHFEKLLGDLKVLITAKAPRKTKLGDYRPSSCGNYHEITFNLPANSSEYPRTLLTVLHEMAHAKVHEIYKGQAAPHGPQWKEVFGKLILSAIELELFPVSMYAALRQHAHSPKARAGSDPQLERALQKEAGANSQVCVDDLAEGSVFSLDGERFFVLGKKLRSRHECKDFDGHYFRITSTAQVRVHGQLKDFPELGQPTVRSVLAHLASGSRFTLNAGSHLIYTKGQAQGNRFLCKANNRKQYLINGQAPLAWHDEG